MCSLSVNPIVALENQYSILLNLFSHVNLQLVLITSIVILLDSHFSILMAWLILSSVLAGYQVIYWVRLLCLFL